MKSNRAPAELGVELWEHVANVLQAMKGIAADLALDGRPADEDRASGGIIDRLGSPLHDRCASHLPVDRTVCPKCGSRVSARATRCVVCGNPLQSGAAAKRRASPQITLSLPVALALLAVFALLASGLTFVADPGHGAGPAAEPTGTPDHHADDHRHPAAVADRDAPSPTATPEPPIEYTVVEGDSAWAWRRFFGVSVQSIVELNRLPATCPLSIGQRLLIPQPTPTPLPPPTETLSPDEATDVACEKVTYTVQDNDTLSGIADELQRLDPGGHGLQRHDQPDRLRRPGPDRPPVRTPADARARRRRRPCRRPTRRRTCCCRAMARLSLWPTAPSRCSGRRSRPCGKTRPIR